MAIDGYMIPKDLQFQWNISRGHALSGDTWMMFTRTRNILALTDGWPAGNIQHSKNHIKTNAISVTLK